MASSHLSSTSTFASARKSLFDVHGIRPSKRILQFTIYLASIYMLKVNNRNARARFRLFKVNNKDTKTISMMSLGCLCC